MKLEVVYNPGDSNYSWKLYTGPADLSDEYDGHCSSLGEVFENVIKYEILNGMTYSYDNSILQKQ